MYVLVVLAVALAAPWFNIPRDQADSAGMLAHLHGHFVGFELLYDDEYARLGVSPLFAFVTPQGVVSNHWPTGATWLQAPGYALGLVAARGLAALDVARADPVGVIPLLGVRAWAVLVLLGAGRVVYRAATRAGGQKAGLVVAWCTVAGTPLLYYAVESPLRPHLWGAAVVLPLVLLWRTPEIGGPRGRALALGALAGLATCIRPQLAPLALLGVHDAWTDRGGRWQRAGLVVAAAAVWPLVHLRLQLWMYGADVGDYATPVSHHLAQFVFSPYHGALSWCPILGVAAALMVLAAWRAERGAWLLLALLALQVWLDAGMRDIEPYRVLGSRTWAGGVAFGPRKLVDVLPLALPATLSVVARARGRRWAAPLAALALAATVPTLLLHLAAFVDPTRTTGAVTDARGLVDTMALAYDKAAWADAFAARRLPWSVAAVVSLVVTLPLLVASIRVARALSSARPAARVDLGWVAVLAAGLVANVWLAVLQVRTDALLAEDPDRIGAVRAWMHPAHEATVSRIPAHHARLRAILGPAAAPPEPP